MPELYSSQEIVRTLEREGFVLVSQRGSHAKYRKRGGTTRTVIVPVGRKQLPRGTFRSIVRQSGLAEEAFERHWRSRPLARAQPLQVAGLVKAVEGAQSVRRLARDTAHVGAIVSVGFDRGLIARAEACSP